MSTEHKAKKPRRKLVLKDITFFTSIEEADAIDNGYPITYNSEKALATSQTNEKEELVYAIKLSREYLNKLYNPYGLCRKNGVDVFYKDNHDIKFEFKKTTKDIFEHYITFLSTRNHIHFLLAEIKQLHYDIPNIEILEWCEGF